MTCPVARRSAGTAETSVLPVAYPADEATDWVQLLSRMDIRERARRARTAREPPATERTAATIATCKTQPVFRPT